MSRQPCCAIPPAQLMLCPCHAQRRERGSHHLSCTLYGGSWVSFTTATLLSDSMILFFSFLLLCIIPSLVVTAAWKARMSCWIWDKAEVPDPVQGLVHSFVLNNANIFWLWIFAVCNLKASLDNPLLWMKDCAWECDFAKYSLNYPSISSLNYVTP